MIQNHLTSQPLSKRLEELGVPQKSEYYWVDDEISRGKPLYAGGGLIGAGQPRPPENISAFLSSELFEKYLGKENIYIYYNGGKVNATGIETSITAENLPEALGLYLEYLILNGLIKL